MADEAPPAQPGPPGPGGDAPDEEELRQRLEEELRKLRIEDVLLQSVVSLINLTSRRIAKPDEQDLDQARVGIEAIRALSDLLDDEPAAQVREALSQLQVAYAQEAGGEGAASDDEPTPEAPQAPEVPQGGAKPASKLWTPHERD